MFILTTGRWVNGLILSGTLPDKVPGIGVLWNSVNVWRRYGVLYCFCIGFVLAILYSLSMYCCIAFSYIQCKKGKGSPYSITERRVPELIPVLGSQPAGDVSHKPGGRLPFLSTRPAVNPATLKRAAINFAAWWTEAQWVWTVCLRLLPDSVATAIWTRALLRLSPAR